MDIDSDQLEFIKTREGRIGVGISNPNGGEEGGFRVLKWLSDDMANSAGAALNKAEDDITMQAALIQEELVRQINNAGRWSAVREAWEALLKVKRMSKSLTEEREHLAPKSDASNARAL